jgi:3-oxoacyl-[acyl-carrier-protein] synthase II
LNLPAFAAFAKLGVIQSTSDGAARACKPCDRQRRGTLLGEGAGLMLLANTAFVEANSLSPEVEVVGYGNTLDGYHMTNPDPTGAGMQRAMRTALLRAGVEADDVDYINLHGTGTRANDEVELAAIQSVFGSRENSVLASSTKDRHGHLIAAAGILEAIVVHLCMTNDFVPRTVNLSNPIAHDGVDLVMASNRFRSLRTCMSNSFAFGGINTSLLFRRGAA